MGATPTPTPGAVEEHMPAFASLWLTGDPEVADEGLSVDLLDPDSPGWSRSLVFEAGTIVRGDIGVSEGTYRLVSGRPDCGLALTLGAEMESDVVMHVPGDGTCSFEVVREHGFDQSHPNAGTVDARVTAIGPDLLVEIRSLDTPANSVPDPVPPDEGGLAILYDVWPGRYEVRLRRDGAVLETQGFTVEETPSGDLVELVLDGRPD